MVGEAAGQDEAERGQPFIGRAGFRLAQMLQRGRMRREAFAVHNVLSCRPPDNKLVKTPWEEASIRHCAPNLDASIRQLRPRCILVMGGVALRRLTDIRIGILDARGYTFWNEEWQTWVFATYHPSYIMRGNHHLEGVFIHDAQRAVEIAQGGHEYIDHSNYLLDPTPQVFDEWVRMYLRKRTHAQHSGEPLWLSCDIETPGKDADEGALDIDAEIEAAILRIGFCYEPGRSVSVPWQAPYIPGIRALLDADGDKLWWHKAFDVPRLIAAGMPVNGTSHDGMVAWHVLNSDVPKSLGFVTTFCVPGQPMWKHLANEQPAYYNAVDPDMALRNMIRTTDELHKVGMWHVYERFVLNLDPVLSQMSALGMPIDHEKRREFALELDTRINTVLDKMRKVVPLEALNHHPKGGYVKEPDDKEGMTCFVTETTVKRCSHCGMENPTKPHFKKYKRPTEKRPQNLCCDAEKVERVEQKVRWAKVVPFKPSPHQILSYQKVQRHRPVMKGRGADRRPTTDENAIKTLMRQHPKDPLYPSVLEFRELDKVAGTYVGRPE